MPHYLIEGSYSPESWAAMVKQPENRVEGARGLVERLGGRIVELYFAFGDSDVFAIVELPDNVNAAALSLAVTASGAFKSFKTTVLMTSDEAMRAMQTAGQAAASYRPPGRSRT